MTWRVYAQLISRWDTDPSSWRSVQLDHPEASADAMREAVRESRREDVMGTLIGLRRVSDALFGFAAAEDAPGGEFTQLLDVVDHAFQVMIDEFLLQPESRDR